MEQLQPQSPPSYVSHNPTDLHLPSVPRHEINHVRTHADITLPDLKTVLSSDFDILSSPSPDRLVSSRHVSPESNRSLPPIDPGLAFGNGVARSSMESNVASPSEAGSVMSLDGGRSASAVSMDDEKVRIAAEALSGLGNPGFARSPPDSAISRESMHGPGCADGAVEEPEPLLQLFAKAHPWVGGTINGSLNAYSTTKNYSPRFVQYGANLVERNITTPVVSTVSSVGRMTGVESGLRWYYGGGPGGTARQRDLEQGADEGQEERMSFESEGISPTHQMHRDSMDLGVEPLPAYRPSKPPSYREAPSPIVAGQRSERPTHSRSWSSQVLVMTSGLGVALSETSRRSLIFCLNMLGQAAEHVETVMHALRMVLEQYDQARDAWHQNHDSSMEKGEGRAATPEQDEAARQLADIIKKHSDDIWQTLKIVVNYVSNSAGGALPENARQFVRTQLMSLPQRWRFVSENQTGDSETSRSAHRMIAFATEGLDMMSQVSQTMKLTLDSAEKWLARVGRRDNSGTAMENGQAYSADTYQHLEKV